MKRKLLLVDDEALQLALLKQAIATIRPNYTIEAVRTATRALALLEQQGDFDLLLTDIKMPVMDGMTLVGRTKDLGLTRLKIIILSGFDDFAYAQQAIRYGVCDYLLKPISRDMLEKTLSAAEQQLDQSQNTKQGLDQNATLSWLINKRILGATLSDKEQYIIHAWQKEDEFICVALVLFPDGQTDPELSETLQASWNGCVGFALHSNCVALVFPKTGTTKREDITRRLMEQCEHSIIGVSQWQPLAMLVPALLGATQMLENAQFINVQGLCEHKMDLMNESMLQEAALSLNYHACKRAVYEFQSALRNGDLSVDDLKEKLISMALRMIDLQKRFFPNQQLKQQFGDEFRSKLVQCRTLTQIADCYSDETKKLIDMQKDEDGFKVNCSLYIQQNFRSDISLARIANHFCYNASYFSFRFSQVFGQSFSKYLTSLRMEQAALLLSNTDAQIAQIAKDVGISDSSYFNKVFKETYQMTPKRYRQYYKADQPR